MGCTAEHLRAIALSKQGAEERQEGPMALFCVADRIFAAIVSTDEALLNLSPEQQSWVMDQSPAFFVAQGGRTGVHLAKAELALVADFVAAAHGNIAPRGLTALGAHFGTDHE